MHQECALWQLRCWMLLQVKLRQTLVCIFLERHKALRNKDCWKLYVDQAFYYAYWHRDQCNPGRIQPQLCPFDWHGKYRGSLCLRNLQISQLCSTDKSKMCSESIELLDVVWRCKKNESNWFCQFLDQWDDNLKIHPLQNNGILNDLGCAKRLLFWMTRQCNDFSTKDTGHTV